MNMETIYLCGGIHGLSDKECKDWRAEVKNKLKGKYKFLDPMRRDYRGKEDLFVNEIIQKDKNDIECSNIVLVNATSPSWGTAMEVFYAHSLGKIVIVFNIGDLTSPWLRYHSICGFDTLKEAIKKLESYLEGKLKND